MQEFGSELKSAREAAGLTLDDLYRATRINPRFFEAMESGEFDILPQVLIKMFLQKYADEVGQDPKETIRNYELARSPAPKPDSTSRQRDRRGVGAGSILGVVLGCVAVAAAAMIFFGDAQESSEAPAIEQAETRGSVAREQPQIRRSTPTPRDSDRPEATPHDRVISAYSLAGIHLDAVQDSVLRLTAYAVDDSRIEVQVDGNPGFAGRIAVGRERRWTARDRFRVDVQDAAALDLALQGQPLKLLAKPGRKVRLFISRASIWVEEIEPSTRSSR